ncbi:Protein of unknown function (DUF3632) domain containing protein [Rhypophila sp. PSN 637]
MRTETTKNEASKDASQLLKDALATVSALTDSTPSTSTDSGAITNVADKIVQGSKLVQKDTQELDNYVYDTWCGIFDLVGKTSSEHQQPIIDLLLELRKTTLYPNDDSSKEPVNVQSAGTLWSDLPTFGWVARDLWNFEASDKTASQSDRQKWTNYTAFLAKLTAVSLSNKEEGNDALDFSTFALWSLREAFETSGSEEANATAGKLASLWIKHAGKELRVATENGVSLLQAQGCGGGEFGERGWTGFNEDRWAVWKGGFRAFAEKDGGASGEGVAAGSGGTGDGEIDEVREMARQAAGLM